MDYVREQESINSIGGYMGFLILCIIVGFLGNIIMPIIEHCPLIFVIGLVTVLFSIVLILKNSFIETNNISDYNISYINNKEPYKPKWEIKANQTYEICYVQYTAGGITYE